jgi:D-alanine transfer protein
MERLGAAGGRPHLFAALVALGLALALLIGGRALAIHRERHNVAEFAPDVFSLKTQGLVLQRAAAQSPDVLPLYGSSELINPPRVRAGDFFRTWPTGFQVSPVGKAGATSLILLQKIGALAGELRNKKVAVSLSSVWFVSSADRYWYEGNFSRFAASQVIFDSGLDLKLKRDIAARMLQYPRSLEKSPLLAFALHRLAAGDRIDRLVFCAIWPLGRIEDAILDLQDHFAALHMLHERHSAPPRRPQTLDWPALIAEAEATSAAHKRETLIATRPHKPPTPGSRDAWFRASLERSPEWTDLQLLLRILKEVHARPLLISMPMNGPNYNPLGVSRSARQGYYDRLGKLAQRYNAKLVDFEDHDEDPNFLDPHLTAKGWILFDHVIDDFMHDRVPHT